MAGYETDLVFGVFRNEEDFRAAIEDLEDLDYYTGDVNIVMRDEKRATEVAESTGTKAPEGAGTGALIGGIGGALLGVAAAATPGGFVLAGPAALAWAAGGAVTGGLVGGLIGLGIPEETAREYVDALEEGDILVAVPNIDAPEVVDILEANGADEVRMISVTPEGTYETSPWLSQHTRSAHESV